MKLAEVCRIVGGGTPSKKNKAYYSGNIPWASVRDMNNPILTFTEFRISDEAVRESATNVIPAGEVIISTHVGLGKVCILAQDTAINQDLKAVIPTVDIDRRYLYHWFVSQAPKLVAAGKGATVKGVTVKFVLDLDIPIPSRNSQQSIAKQLSLVLECVKKRQAQLARLDALAKSLFVEMFGDPADNPKGWTSSKLGDCLESIDNGTSFVCRDYARNGFAPAILKLGAVTYGVFRPEENKELVSESDFIAKDEVHDGDLLFTRKNTPELVGMAALVRETPPRLMMPDLVFRLNPKSVCRKEYLWSLINFTSFRPFIQRLASGSAKSMSNISKQRLGSLEIPLPPSLLQKSFAEHLERIDKSKFAILRWLSYFDREAATKSARRGWQAAPSRDCD